MTWPFGDLVAGAYRVVLADPPWSFTTYSVAGHAKTPHAHYGCMTLEDIKALPVQSLAAPDGCALVLWATAPMLPEALVVMAAWGFTFKTAGAWAKRSKSGEKWAFGTGYILRSAAEFWLIGTRGKIARPLARNVRNLLVDPVREHSRKPDSIYENVERMWPGPRAELFGRERRPGWDGFGNQLDKFPERAALPDCAKECG